MSASTGAAGPLGGPRGATAPAEPPGPPASEPGEAAETDGSAGTPAYHSDDFVVSGQRALAWGFLLCGVGLALTFLVTDVANSGPPTVLGWVGWGLWAACFGLLMLGSLVGGGRLPSPIAGAGVALIGALLVVDVLSSSIWPGLDEPRALLAVGGLVAAATGLRPARQMTVFATAFLIVVGGVQLWRAGFDPRQIAITFVVIFTSAGPALAFCWFLNTLQRMLRNDSERARIQSAARSPSQWAGRQAGERLLRLDRRAERLLAQVGDGSLALPLEPEQAQLAADLADELRHRLNSERQGTWLRHAIDESARLGESVTLHDPDALAARLTETQRDSLLTAAWLLLNDSGRTGQRLLLAFHEESPPGVPAGQGIRITISSAGIPFARVDGAVWGALAGVGPVESRRTGPSFRATVHASAGRSPRRGRSGPRV